MNSTGAPAILQGEGGEVFYLRHRGTRRLLPRCWLKERHQASV
uniref:Uncharacterized protein n=1 Tax=Anguilla anguilla TaxID=7936 RepID=A0A0E9Q2L5_ANGAN